MRKGFSIVPIVLLALTLMAGCAPQPAPGERATGSGVPAAQPRAEKTITIAIQREPDAFVLEIGSGASKSGGASNVEWIGHETLVVENEKGEFTPRLAVEQISTDNGTWRLNPDGTMDTIWKIRPNIKWHDGTPFTSQDLLFSINVDKDPDIPAGRNAARSLIESATAPDPQTFIVHWSKPYVDAYKAEFGDILPRHLLSDLYETDKTRFLNSPRFGPEFVGLGPYRLAEWQPGSHMRFVRFDDYFRGPAPIDVVVVRFVGDPNTMVTNMLSGTVDVIVPRGVELNTALELRRRWEGTGNQVRTDPRPNLPQLEMQFRPDASRPRNGFTEPAVRQAFYHAIDRKTLVDVLTEGLAPVADSWISPTEALYQDVRDSIPQYPYDLNRAQQLLSQAGWSRGPDGMLVNAANGERFEIDLWGQQGQAEPAEKTLSIIGDNWKAVGADSRLYIVPAARQSDAEYVSMHPGPLLTSPSGDTFYRTRLHTREIGTPANQYKLANRGAYSRPNIDAAIDRLSVTLDPRERVGLHRQLLQEAMGEVALMPLYFAVDPILMVKGVRGPIQVRNEATWNIFDWTRED